MHACDLSSWQDIVSMCHLAKDRLSKPRSVGGINQRLSGSANHNHCFKLVNTVQLPLGVTHPTPTILFFRVRSLILWSPVAMTPIPTSPWSSSLSFGILISHYNRWDPCLLPMYPGRPYSARRSESLLKNTLFLYSSCLSLPKDGSPDRSYFSADCFHLSQKAQTSMARSLWNNMVKLCYNELV